MDPLSEDAAVSAHLRLELRNARNLMASMRDREKRLEADLGASRAENSRLNKYISILEKEFGRTRPEPER